MKTLQEISNGFHAEYGAQEKRCKAMSEEADKKRNAALRYQRLAAQKMGEYYKLHRKINLDDKIGWIGHLLRPLLEEIEQRTGWEFDNKNDLHTFGLRAECPVHIATGEVNEHGFPKYKAYITFTPEFERRNDGTYHWELWYDTCEKKAERYAPMSIGGLNGFDNVTAKVESVEQIIEFLQKQMDDDNNGQ